MPSLPSTYDGPIPIAIIGGTGLRTLAHLTPAARLPLTHPALRTPWGAPSAPIDVLRYAPEGTEKEGPGIGVAFLARHGIYHELAPHEVNNRANVAALRRLGVRCVVAFSAVGSLREEVRPRDFVVVDQVIDRTKGVRPWTFFEGGVVGHVGFADPFDNQLRDLVVRAIKEPGVLEGDGIQLHESGTVICMEGPQFSTRAESLLYRTWGASVINMSVLPEAKLFREAELGYALICMSTDYDSWHSTNETVSVDMVMGHLAANSHNATRVIDAVLVALAAADDAHVAAVREGSAWEGASRGGLGMTKEEGRGKEAVERLRWLFPEYF